MMQEDLIEKLVITARELDELENRLLPKLDRNDPAANAELKSGIEKATAIYREIGNELNRLGGMQAMRLAISKVSNDYSAHTVISSAWEGIGDWRF